MTHKQPQITPSDVICGSPLVGKEFGTPIDQDLLLELQGDALTRSLAMRIATEHTNWKEQKLLRVGATEALGKLGCSTCPIREMCGVANELENLAQPDGERTDLEKLLVETPDWLLLARLESLGPEFDIPDFIGLLQSETNRNRLAALLPLETGIAEKIRAKVEMIKTGYVHASDIPGVRDFASLKGEYRSDLLQADNGRRFDVIDTTDTDPKLITENISIKAKLLHRLLEQITETGEDNKPHIFNNDGKRQSSIGSVKPSDGAEAIEIKLNGHKWRLYCVVHHDHDTQIITIVILGYQFDGNDSTQKRVISKIFK